MTLYYTAEFWKFENWRTPALTLQADTAEELLAKVHAATEQQKKLARCRITYGRTVEAGKDPAKDMQQIIELSNLSRQEFCNRYHLQYRTVSSWVHGERDCPTYVREGLYFRVLTDIRDGYLTP